MVPGHECAQGHPRRCRPAREPARELTRELAFAGRQPDDDHDRSPRRRGAAGRRDRIPPPPQAQARRENGRITGLIDLHHRGSDRVIGSYLLDTPDGPALFDCGPASCSAALSEGLAANGLSLQDVRHLLLSHIHLDHAGAAGVLVREHPHLVDPSRLERSARRLYGDSFDELWGELAPVPERNVHVVQRKTLGFEVFPAPGHASHHVVYVGADGTLYAGDAAGVRIQPDAYVAPPTPPPEFDLEAWDRTLDEIERRRPNRLALIHFGWVDDPQPHLDKLRARLHTWTGWVREGVTEEQFLVKAGAERDLASTEPEIGEKAMPLWQSYAGLRRYVDKAAPTVTSR
jgi:glyoxylase-like metal-dependent hydrolase (beta-lactamase superfamily II)